MEEAGLSLQMMSRLRQSLLEPDARKVDRACSASVRGRQEPSRLRKVSGLAYGQLGPVRFPDRVEEYAHSYHIDDQHEIVNVTGIPRMVRMLVDGNVEEFVVEPWKFGEVARSDDENTWPVKKEGVIVLVPEEMGHLREDFREFSRKIGLLGIAF
jgi:hypothetical protein